MWIGEVLMAKETFALADAFFRSAIRRWEQVSPPRASKATALLSVAISRVPTGERIPDTSVEKVCLDWILGRGRDDTVAVLPRNWNSAKCGLDRNELIRR